MPDPGKTLKHKMLRVYQFSVSLLWLWNTFASK